MIVLDYVIQKQNTNVETGVLITKVTVTAVMSLLPSPAQSTVAWPQVTPAPGTPKFIILSAPTAQQFLEQNLVTKFVQRTVPHPQLTPRVKSHATVLMKMVGINVATPADTSGCVQMNVTRIPSTYAEMSVQVLGTPTPASVVTSPSTSTVLPIAAWNRKIPANMIILTLMVVLEAQYALVAQQFKDHSLVMESVPRPVF